MDLQNLIHIPEVRAAIQKVIDELEALEPKTQAPKILRRPKKKPTARHKKTRKR